MRFEMQVCMFMYFNPRSHERSDHRCSCYLICLSRFQSTLPREERRIKDVVCRITGNISIHAPTRGATVFPAKLLPSKIFQSTLPREERHLFHVVFPGKLLFQSTLPREERQVKTKDTGIVFKFQSTLPREERQQYCTKNLFIFIQYRQ